MSIANSKQCSRCDQVKPVSEFSKSSRMASGIRSECLECSRADSRRRYQRRAESIDYDAIDMTQTKVCSGCSVNKPLSEFSPDATNSTGFKGRCRECRRPEYRRWAHAARERRKQQ